jgi:hypothetical protein
MTGFFEQVLREDPGPAGQKRRKRPWWQLTKTARQGFIAGPCWLAFGLAFLLAGAAAGYGGWPVGFFYLAGGACYLASAVALRRRERAGEPPGPAAGRHLP